MAYFSNSRPQSSSSAIKIVNPADNEDKAKLHKRAARYCRYQDRGCIYYHPPVETSNNQPRSESPTPPSLSAQAVNAPVFVPNAAFHGIATPPPTFAPSPPHSTFYQTHDEYDNYGDTISNHTPQLLEHQLVNQYQQVDYEDHDSPIGNFYQSQRASFVKQPLDYHLYSHPTPDAFPSTHFVSDAVREELHKRSEASQLVTIPGHNLPDELQGYHSLALLEPPVAERRKFFSWYSTVYRATSSNDGVVYALRRVENFRLMHQAAFGAIETWSRVEHPNIARVREAFTSRAFNDNSLVVAYDYYPNAQTLFEIHIKQKPPVFQHGRLSTVSTALPEATLWSYIIQIASSIKAVHEVGLAVRMIDATKIMVTGKNRIRIGSCGIADVLMYDPRQDTAIVQQEDLTMFGRLIFALCCNNLAAMNTLPKAIDMMGRQYSADVKTLALYLISKPGSHKNIAQVIDMIGTNRLIREMDETHNSVNRLEAELMGELENGRLVRLLCKFGFINERPVFAREPRWSETGDRYIIKLFRDYVFHQVDENGNPVINLTHVLSCLNKLDAGTDERIMLVSRDEQSCLVVSYKDVKACIDAAFGDLARASR
ncbi:hypothetical protein K503DRAFT_768340 [Rhizopogon vinicolor AM-OR11-026]|uniref:PAN2-PAN3 deadenylation complex subunit PAN3 n=1 Tax=Rhizopogon vinicolor AM-OR11-026 TaxID=1314800 RepID=A0A1B7N750_9AGAM|nr:hypothetical protein K503DRAFT_768340 [Rhizopogon vinicolor AM-OR11-026]